MERILDGDNLNKAYLKVASDKGVPGVDKMLVKDLSPYAMEVIVLNQRLVNLLYQFATCTQAKNMPPEGEGIKAVKPLSGQPFVWVKPKTSHTRCCDWSCESKHLIRDRKIRHLTYYASLKADFGRVADITFR
jgi:hypothetical protein